MTIAEIGVGVLNVVAKFISLHLSSAHKFRQHSHGPSQERKENIKVLEEKQDFRKEPEERPACRQGGQKEICLF